MQGRFFLCLALAFCACAKSAPVRQPGSTHDLGGAGDLAGTGGADLSSGMNTDDGPMSLPDDLSGLESGTAYGEFD